MFLFCFVCLFVCFFWVGGAVATRRRRPRHAVENGQGRHPRTAQASKAARRHLVVRRRRRGGFQRVAAFRGPSAQADAVAAARRARRRNQRGRKRRPQLLGVPSRGARQCPAAGVTVALGLNSRSLSLSRFLCFFIFVRRSLPTRQASTASSSNSAWPRYPRRRRGAPFFESKPRA